MATYYVAKSGDGGNNANSGLSVGSPKLTIAAAVALMVGGDTLFVRQGTWTEQEIVLPNGTSGAHTTVKSYNQDTVIFAAPNGNTFLFYQNARQYIDIIGGTTAGLSRTCKIIFDGPGKSLDTTGGVAFSQINQSSNITFDGCRFTDWGGVAINISSTGGITFRNCRIDNNGWFLTPEDQAGYGFYIGGSNVLVDNCEIDNNGGYAIHQYTEDQVPSNNIYRNNFIHDNGQVPNTNSADGILLYGAISNPSNNQAYNNVIWNNALGYGIRVRNQLNAKVYNNTIYGNGTDNGANGIWIQSGTGAIVRNNISVENGAAAILDNGTSTTADHNWVDADGDPFFLSAGSDFHLTAVSPVIDAGTDLTSAGITADVEGTPRPSGGGFDIGAYEYVQLSQENPFEAPGTAHGTSTAVAVGRAVAPQGAGSAAGTSTVLGVGLSQSRQGAGSAAGIATVVGRAQLAPVAVVEAVKTYTIRIREIRTGANGIIECEGVREDISVYDSVSQSPLLGSLVNSGTPAPEPTPTQDNQSDNSRPGSTRLVLLDIPQLRTVDTEPGFYAAATGTSPGWNGAILHEKIGADWVQIAELGQRAAIGQATTKLLTGPVTDFDETGRTYNYDDTNTVDITLLESVSQLVSVTDGDLEVGVNAAAIGINGRWEIIAFGTATQLGERQWRLSHLLRGLKGTEWAVGLHVAGDQFVLLNESLRRVTDTYPDLDVARSFRGVSIGTLLEDTSTQIFTNTGISLKPLSPVFIRGEEDANDNRTLRAYRRSRWDGLAGRDSADPPPLDEPNLVMEWDIRNSLGTLVLRTLTSITESVAYTAAQQVADFGSVPASLNVCVYQISANRGRGYSGCAVISSFDTEDVPGELIALVVEEEDGDPSVTQTSKIQFDQDSGLTVEEAAEGVALVHISGAITDSGFTQSTGKLLGRSTASTGSIEEITVGTGLSLSSGTLSTTTGGGGLELIEHQIIGTTTNTMTFAATLDGDTDGIYMLVMKILCASGLGSGNFTYYRLTPNGVTSNQFGDLEYVNPSTHAWQGNNGIPYLGFADDGTWMMSKVLIHARQSISAVDAPMLFEGGGHNRDASNVVWHFLLNGGWSAASAANITSLAVISILANGTTQNNGIADGSEFHLYKMAQ